MKKQFENFNFEVEQDPIVQLHKTDYNNYSDLSHFVDEYYKAQSLIKECNNFYKSFLLSKLLPYSKINNTSYKENSYNFFNIEITGTLYKGETFSIYDELDEVTDEQYKNLYNYKSLKGYVNLAYSKAVFKFKDICEKSQDKLFIPYIKCERTVYFPGYKDECSYYFSFNDYILKDFSEHHYISSYGNIMFNNEYDKKELQKRLKKLCEIDNVKLYDYMKNINSSYKKEFKEIFKDELKHILKDISYPIINVKIKNDLKNIAYNCYKSYIKKVKKKDIDPEIKKLLDTYKNDGEITSIVLTDILSNDEIDEMINSFDLTYDYADSLILKYINDNCYDKVIELTKNNISDSTYAYRTIIRQCNEYDSNQQLYIIGKHNESHYFCNQKDVDKIKIELKKRKLICTYTETHKKLKYCWPSDAPWVVNELTREVVFNVDNNTVCSFSEDKNTYEISRDRY